MDIYPGHMAKAKRVLKESLKNIDLVVEVLDARIPDSSHNEEIKDIIKNKERIIVLNKMDLAEEKYTNSWRNIIKKKLSCIKINSPQKKGIEDLIDLMEQMQTTINEIRVEKGIKKRPIRVIVIGIPNVGKSALINGIVKRSSAKTGNKPGVTRGKQWIGVKENIDLLDMPGILYPKAKDEETAYKLVLTGAVELKKVDAETAAYKLLKLLKKLNRLKRIIDHYNINTDSTVHPYDILAKIGRKRGCLMSGGKIDRNRTAQILINDFQKGFLGRISLERPESDNYEF